MLTLLDLPWISHRISSTLHPSRKDTLLRCQFSNPYIWMSKDWLPSGKESMHNLWRTSVNPSKLEFNWKYAEEEETIILEFIRIQPKQRKIGMIIGSEIGWIIITKSPNAKGFYFHSFCKWFWILLTQGFPQTFSHSLYRGRECMSASLTISPEKWFHFLTAKAYLRLRRRQSPFSEVSRHVPWHMLIGFFLSCLIYQFLLLHDVVLQIRIISVLFF